MILLIDVFDKVGSSQQHNRVLTILFSETFLENFRQIIFLSDNEMALYFNTGSDKLNKAILQFKESVMKVFIKLMIYSEWNFAGKPEKEQLFNYYRNILPDFVNGLYQVTASAELNDLIAENENLTKLLTKSCSFVTRLIKEAEFNEFFNEHRFRIVLDIGMSLLRTFKPELLEIDDNPSQFVRIALDTCDR